MENQIKKKKIYLDFENFKKKFFYKKITKNFFTFQFYEINSQEFIIEINFNGCSRWQSIYFKFNPLRFFILITRIIQKMQIKITDIPRKRGHHRDKKKLWFHEYKVSLITFYCT